MSKVQFVLHNSSASNGHAMEVYSDSEVKQMLDRTKDILGGTFHLRSKDLVGKLIDGRIDEVFVRRQHEGLCSITLASEDQRKDVHIYYATLGKAE